MPLLLVVTFYILYDQAINHFVFYYQPLVLSVKSQSDESMGFFSSSDSSTIQNTFTAYSMVILDKSDCVAERKHLSLTGVEEKSSRYGK